MYTIFVVKVFVMIQIRQFISQTTFGDFFLKKEASMCVHCWLAKHLLSTQRIRGTCVVYRASRGHQCLMLQLLATSLTLDYGACPLHYFHFALNHCNIYIIADLSRPQLGCTLNFHRIRPIAVIDSLILHSVIVGSTLRVIRDFAVI